MYNENREWLALHVETISVFEMVDDYDGLRKYIAKHCGPRLDETALFYECVAACIDNQADEGTEGFAFAAFVETHGFWGYHNVDELMASDMYDDMGVDLPLPLHRVLCDMPHVTAFINQHVAELWGTPAIDDFNLYLAARSLSS